MGDIGDIVRARAAETEFAGVVRVDVGDRTTFAEAFGLADRARGLPMTVDTQLAIASGSKTMTALAVMSLVEDGTLTLHTTARSLLGDDLPLIGDDVTVEHLLSHRSGIGDYLDEEILDDGDAYVLTVPVHQLATTEPFLAILDGFATKFPAGSEFSYCNGGYMVLALIAERAAGVGYHDLVQRRVLDPAGMTDSGYFRSDDLPGRAALGYVHVDGAWRSNVFHLPVRGNGDGGLFTTAADVHQFWQSFMSGRIVGGATVAEMVRPRSTYNHERYGLGCWLHGTGDAVMLEGGDAGVSFRSVHSPGNGTTHTVLANTSSGMWPISKALDAALPVTPVRPEDATPDPAGPAGGPVR